MQGWVRPEPWLVVVLCLHWRPWNSLQAELYAATSWTHPIGPWPSPLQPALKPHWVWVRMEEIAPGDWLAKSFNYSDFTTGPEWRHQWRLAGSVKQRRECSASENISTDLTVMFSRFKWNLRFYLRNGNCCGFHNIDGRPRWNTGDWGFSVFAVKGIKAHLFVTSWPLQISGDFPNLNFEMGDGGYEYIFLNGI